MKKQKKSRKKSQELFLRTQFKKALLWKMFLRRKSSRPMNFRKQKLRFSNLKRKKKQAIVQKNLERLTAPRNLKLPLLRPRSTMMSQKFLK